MSYGIEIRKPNSNNIITSEYTCLQIGAEKNASYSGTGPSPNLAYYYDFSNLFSESELSGYTNLFIEAPVGTYLSLDSSPSVPGYAAVYSNRTNLNFKLGKPANLLNENNYDLEVYNSSGEKIYIASKKLMTITGNLVTTFGAINTLYGGASPLVVNSSADWISFLSKIVIYFYQGFGGGVRYNIVAYRANASQWTFEVAPIAIGPPVNFAPSSSHQIKFFFSDSTI